MKAAAARASARRLIGANGETIVLRRYSGTGTSRAVSASASVRARVMSYRPEQIVGFVKEGDLKVIVLAEDIEAQSAFTAPPHKGDKAVVRGKEFNIEAVDDHTRRVGGTLVAYEMTVRG